MIGETTYDRILITGAFTTIPRTFQEQTCIGRLPCWLPLMLRENHCKLVRLTKVGSRFERTGPVRCSLSAADTAYGFSTVKRIALPVSMV